MRTLHPPAAVLTVRRPALIAMLLAIVVALLSTATAIAAARAVAADAPLAASVGSAIDAARVSNDLRSLRASPALSRAASQHAQSMAELGYFSHSSADGSTSVERITSFYTVRGAIQWSVGEVMIWSPGALSANEIVQRWLASPPHRAELLNRGYRELGAAAVHADNAPGVFGGRDVTIVVVDFGARR